MSTVFIRPLMLSDLDAYRRLRLEALQRHPEAFSSDYAQHLSYPDDFWQKRVQQLVQDPASCMFVAERNGELLGMTGIGYGDSPKTRHSALVWAVYVRPAARGAKLGDRLIQACLQWGREHGVRVVKLGVLVSNQPAIACYERCGFRLYGTEPKALCIEGQDYDEYLMACVLADERS